MLIIEQKIRAVLGRIQPAHTMCSVCINQSDVLGPLAILEVCQPWEHPVQRRSDGRGVDGTDGVCESRSGTTRHSWRHLNSAMPTSCLFWIRIAPLDNLMSLADDTCILHPAIWWRCLRCRLLARLACSSSVREHWKIQPSHATHSDRSTVAGCPAVVLRVHLHIGVAHVTTLKHGHVSEFFVHSLLRTTPALLPCERACFDTSRSCPRSPNYLSRCSDSMVMFADRKMTADSRTVWQTGASGLGCRGSRTDN